MREGGRCYLNYRLEFRVHAVFLGDRLKAELRTTLG